LAGWQEGHPARKKTEWWGAGMVSCLERDADLHMAQLMPLPLTVLCFSKIQIGFTFLVPAHPGSPGKRPLNGYVYVCVISMNARKRVCSSQIFKVLPQQYAKVSSVHVKCKSHLYIFFNV